MVGEPDVFRICLIPRRTYLDRSIDEFLSEYLRLPHLGSLCEVSDWKVLSWPVTEEARQMANGRLEVGTMK